MMLATTSFAQVKISVPEQHYKVREQILTKVENLGSRPVTLCIGFLGMAESTPSPFWVQRNGEGKWRTLIMGPDSGNQGTALVLEAYESREFFVRLSDPGRMRLKLDYWKGSIPKLDCDAPTRGSKVVMSDVFTILPTSLQSDESSAHDPIITAADVASLPKIGNGKLIGTVSSHESLGSLRVSITKVGETAVFATQRLDNKGGFEFGDVAPGEYQVSVADLNSCLRYSTTVRIEPGKTKKLSIGRSQRIRPNLCE
jgi:hypothetical protein